MRTICGCPDLVLAWQLHGASLFYGRNISTRRWASGGLEMEMELLW